MATLDTKFKLNTGAEIPAVGFGTWQDKDAQEGAVAEALKAGYTHIDTARIYGTEPAVGAAIKKSGIPRSKIFITTKLWNNAHHPDDVEPALDASLADLGTDYVDLYLMHWPVAFGRGDTMVPKDNNGKIINGDTDFVDTWKAMEKTFKKGKAKAIGISNFSRKETERLLKETEVVPAAHQIEVHPYLQQNEACEWFRSKGIHVQQYSPFGNQNEIYSKGQNMGKLIDDPTLVEIGKKYNKNGAQVALAWGIAQGHSVLPKSKTPSRIKDNLEGDFKLEKEDLEKLKGVDKGMRFNDPSANFGWNFYVGEDGKVE
ncbi:MAG: hypothetical protein L6R38_004540 [Xanthoria sp. 2 TBL-2021]|nr:MAG: hypothetical protein L6R38_004540 [Xanthoria sp. 2 TBL-2021]